MMNPPLKDLDALVAPNAIAVVGMAGRFPGARNLDELRHNLDAGVESITVLSDRELLDAGVDPGLLADPRYVKAVPLLEDADRFDAAFFGYSPREAAIMDPQQRLFLECAWEALRDGDAMHAVIRGTAVSNDGGTKTSRWAPHSDGQAEAMRRAVAAAQIDPATIRSRSTWSTRRSSAWRHDPARPERNRHQGAAERAPESAASPETGSPRTRR